MIFAKLEQLPPTHTCKLCGQVKPLAEMIVVRLRKENAYKLRPRCKACHNERERGHRREWKRKYLAEWRARKPVLTKSYYDNDTAREQARVRAARYVARDHDALLIQGRLRRAGMPCTLDEARAYLAQYGRCYPTRAGLTKKGLQECERIRGSLRRVQGKRRLSALEIRLMVYEDGLHLPPHKQPVPYQKAAARLREWQRARKRENAR